MQADKRDEHRRRELVALLGVLAIAVPLASLLLGALADGLERRHDAPLAAVLGMEAFARFRNLDPEAVGGRGEGLHYLAPEDRSKRLKAKDFSLPTRTGGTFRLSDHAGKVLVLNFWSITCRPCIEEMPSLIELGLRLKDRTDVELITISTDENWNAVKRLFRESATGPERVPPFEILFDPEKRVVKELFGTRAYPETWFIDGEGVIRLRVDGPKDWSQPVVLDVIDLLAS